MYLRINAEISEWSIKHPFIKCFDLGLFWLNTSIPIIHYNIIICILGLAKIHKTYYIVYFIINFSSTSYKFVTFRKFIRILYDAVRFTNYNTVGFIAFVIKMHTQFCLFNIRNSIRVHIAHIYSNKLFNDFVYDTLFIINCHIIIILATYIFGFVGIL